MMKASAAWGKHSVRALSGGIVCSVLVYFLLVFTVHSSGMLWHVTRTAVAPGIFAENWVFGPPPADVEYHDGRRILVAFVATSLFYAALILLLSLAPRLLSSARSEKRMAKGE